LAKATKKKRAIRKLRTRDHIIEELSINFFQRRVLLCGYSLERVESDYGYDLLLFTYNNIGEIENGSVTIQMKASDHFAFNSKNCIPFDVDTRDLNLWLNQYDPVLLVVYDAKKDKAYWLDIQDYFKSLTLSAKHKKQKSFRVQIPKRNKVGVSSVRKYAKLKNDRYNIINTFN
jgi:hypothetical protein